MSSKTQAMFDYTKEAARSRKSRKDRHYNGQKKKARQYNGQKKDKRTSDHLQNTTQKT